jgi:hypothetical protein
MYSLNDGGYKPTLVDCVPLCTPKTLEVSSDMHIPHSHTHNHIKYVLEYFQTIILIEETILIEEKIRGSKDRSSLLRTPLKVPNKKEWEEKKYALPTSTI